MRKITLVCFGKLKTPGLEPAVAEFTRRIGRFTDFESIELKPLPVPEKSDAHRNRIPEEEGERVAQLLQSPGFRTRAGKSPALWCLDERGKGLPTREWAARLQGLADSGSGELVLLIGGSLGLGHNIRNQADLQLSLGPQTLSHELARLILVEQLYRALSFNAGHPYHNEG